MVSIYKQNNQRQSTPDTSVHEELSKSLDFINSNYGPSPNYASSFQFRNASPWEVSASLNNRSFGNALNIPMR